MIQHHTKPESQFYLDAREVSRNAAGLNPQERRLAWFLHSLSCEPEGESRFVGEVVKRLEGISRPMPPHEKDSRSIRRRTAEYEGNEPPVFPAWFSSYDDDDTLLSLRAWASGEDRSFNDSGREMIQAALALMTQWNTEAVSSFYQTNIGQKVWKTLDWCLQTRRPVSLWGEAGKGKTASLKAWCEAHRGEARYFSADSYGNQSDFFRDALRSFGLRQLDHMSASEARYRFKQLAKEAGLVIVIDEIHFALNHRDRTGRPPIIDWLDTALVDSGIPVAICGTPQFATRLAEIGRKTGYNTEQFCRRFANRWVTLQEKTDMKDLAALADRHLPHISTAQRKQAVEYARWNRDVSGLFDLVSESQEAARIAGRVSPNSDDFAAALTVRLANDTAMDAAFALPVRRSANQRQTVCEPSAAEVQTPRRTPALASPVISSPVLAERSSPVLVEG